MVWTDELLRISPLLSISRAIEKKKHLFEGFSFAQQMSSCNQIAPSGHFLQEKHMGETRSLALLARIIGRRHGVEVEFSNAARTASTDGKKITLPVVSNLGTEDHAVLIEGLVDHEAMHCRFTDFEAVSLSKLEPLLACLTNIIEDVWGEREQGKIYPGCARNIRRAMDVMIRLDWYRGPQAAGQEPPSMLVTNFLLHGLLARLYGSAQLGDFSAQYRMQLESVLGVDLVQQIWDLACQVDRVMSTQQALALAREIVGLLQTAQKDDQKGGGTDGAKDAEAKASDQTGPDNPPDSGSGTESSGSGSDTGASQACGPSDPSAQPEGGVGHGGHPGDAIKQILGASPDQLASGDMGDRLLAALRGEGKVDFGSGSSRGEAYEVLQPALPGPGRTQKIQDAAIGMARSIEIKLGTRLESLLETKTDSLVMHKRLGRRLESRRVPRISMGKLDVFRSLEEAESLDTAVFFLVDASGSMFGNFDGRSPDDFGETRISAAVAVTYAASQVLHKHGIPFGVACFGSAHLPLKGLDDRWPLVCRYGMGIHLGGTMTGFALSKAVEALIQRVEARKLVVVVTDGQPDDVGHTVAVLDESRRVGIETAVLFIGSQGRALEDLLKNAGYQVARSKNLEDLSTSFFDAVKSAF